MEELEIALEQESNEEQEVGLTNEEKYIVPTIGENGNWYIASEDTGKPSRGEKGDKGDKGDAGSIEFIIVTELPTENIDENAIYMKQSTNIEDQNTYEEFIYVNGAWESLGVAQVEVDLTDYIKNTDYATPDKAGVIKTSTLYGLGSLGSGMAYVINASETDINNKTTKYRPIVPANLDYAVKTSITTNTETLTEEEKANVQDWLGVTEIVGDIETLLGGI